MPIRAARVFILTAAVQVDDSRFDDEANVNHGEVTAGSKSSRTRICELIEKPTQQNAQSSIAFHAIVEIFDRKTSGD